MNLSKILIIIGLSLNTLASVVMLYPYINITKNIEDDYIIKMDKNTGKYTQKKHKKDKILGVIGLVLFIIGFILQIVGVSI